MTVINYYSLYMFFAIFSILMIRLCRAEDLVPIDIELDEDVCTMPIAEGDCGSQSGSTSNDDTIVYFGYNRNSTKCEEFIYEGCGGNDNRFESSEDCWKACYTPLKYFLARVSNFLNYRYNNSINWTIE